MISYDIHKHIPENHKIYTKNNIEFRIKNILDDLNSEFLKNIKIIMIDIDHMYTTEKKILDRLRELNYNGIVLLDDIHHYKQPYIEPMKKLWEEIKEEKYDITNLDHSSGTGLVIFGDHIKISIL